MSEGDRPTPRRSDARAALREHAGGLDPEALGTAVDLAEIGGYRGYAELVRAWLAIAESGARAWIIGRTAGDAPMVALGFGPERAPLTSVVVAGLHPIEWIGVETAMALCRRLAANPPRERSVVVCPLVNVDGYRAVEADLRDGRRRWRRSNARGVDLNRNWPAFFKQRRFKGPCGLGYGGGEPLSEPETRAVSEFCERIAGNSRIDVALSLHSFGRMILTPWGGSRRRPDGFAALDAAARALQARMPERYRVRQTSRWLPGIAARGIEIDTFHQRYGATTLLVECSGGGLRLSRPKSWLHPFRWYNPPDRRRVSESLSEALEPTVLGGQRSRGAPGGPSERV